MAEEYAPDRVTVDAKDLRWGLRFMVVDGQHTREVKTRLAAAIGLTFEEVSKW